MFSKNSILIYKDTKRNEKCPCGSGKIFKKCCTKEYRETKRLLNSAVFSTFSPIQPLATEYVDIFQNTYKHILIFTHYYKNRLEVKSLVDFTFEFDHDEREFLYKNRTRILDNFQKTFPLNDEEQEVVDAIREATFDIFALCEYRDKTAVVVDTTSEAYSVQSLKIPFTDIFREKNLLVYSTVIPYKNRYIMDGYYTFIRTSQQTVKEIKKLPSYGLKVNFNKNNTIIPFPISINFCLATDTLGYEKMEEVILKNLSNQFPKDILKLFDNTPFESKFLLSSLIRSIDFLYYLEEDELNRINIINGLPVSNFEKNSNNPIIPYTILEKYYQQKSLDESVSKDINKNIKIGKDLIAQGNKNLFQASSFYTMFGVFYIDEAEIEEFEFLTPLREERGRRAFTEVIERHFDKINQDFDLDIIPVYLDFGLDYHEIGNIIDEYRESKGGLYNVETMQEIKEYSIYKGKRRGLLELL